MSVIENFAALSAQKQREFAAALIKTINSESTFISNITFDLVNVEADDMTGGLLIEVSHEPMIEVTRKATWQAGDEDEASSGPDSDYGADYSEAVTTDAEKAFKTLSTEIDGYTVSLDISDVDEEETIEVEIDHISHEDSGIGHYEFWGEPGYDSQPYVEVEGTIVQACTCSLAFFVEPTESTEPAEVTEE